MRKRPYLSPESQVVLPQLRESVALRAQGSDGANEGQQLSKDQSFFDEDEGEYPSPCDKEDKDEIFN